MAEINRNNQFRRKYHKLLEMSGISDYSVIDALAKEDEQIRTDKVYKDFKARLEKKKCGDAHG